MLRNNKHPNPHLQNSWNFYKEISFKFEIIKKISDKDLLNAEQEYLNIARTTPNLFYNIGYDSQCAARGVKRSNKTKILMSKWQRGRKLSKEHCENISKSIKGRISINLDKTIYVFKNHKTNEIFTGTQNDFYKKYNIDQGNVNRMINKKRKSCKNWILWCCGY